MMATKILNKVVIISALVALITLLFFLKESQNHKASNVTLLNGVEMTVYKSPTCGCCAEYVSYLESKGVKVLVEETQEMNKVKSRNRVPVTLESCHTSIVNGYVVEGHVPAEAIRKLLDEKLEIVGIALPEMPAGSPGMGGTKIQPFRIHVINSDGEDGGVFVEL